MVLLIGAEYSEELKKCLSKAEQSVVVLSAFIKLPALIWLHNNLPQSEHVDLTIITRWKPQDLISGASDTTCYEFARTQKWKFAVDQSLHSKIFLIDETIIFLGSANLTQKGLHLIPDCNVEAGTMFDVQEHDLNRIKSYVEDCSPITDKIFEDIKNWIEEQEPQPKIYGDRWPQFIRNRLVSPSTTLWVNDLIFFTPQELLEEGDSLINKEEAIEDFYCSKIWLWLLEQIKKSENEYVLFGEITSLLHDALLDDPKPYRKTVKQFVSIFFEWVRYLEPAELGIKKFNYTEALFLK